MKGYITKSRAGHYVATLKNSKGQTIARSERMPCLEWAQAELEDMKRAAAPIREIAVQSATTELVSIGPGHPEYRG